MTGFFVPGVEPEQAEDRYAQLVEAVGGEVADPADRIRSLRFTSGAEEWTATVGERLSGQLAAKTDRRPARRSSPTRSAPARLVSDPATVQAIVRTGDSYLVVTDGRPLGAIDDSVWDNPFPVTHGDTRGIVRFDG